jgi:hypothetical protein
LPIFRRKPTKEVEMKEKGIVAKSKGRMMIAQITPLAIPNDISNKYILLHSIILFKRCN